MDPRDASDGPSPGAPRDALWQRALDESGGDLVAARARYLALHGALPPAPTVTPEPAQASAWDFALTFVGGLLIAVGVFLIAATAFYGLATDTRVPVGTALVAVACGIACAALGAYVLRLMTRILQLPPSGPPADASPPRRQLP